MTIARVARITLASAVLLAAGFLMAGAISVAQSPTPSAPVSVVGSPPAATMCPSPGVPVVASPASSLAPPESPAVSAASSAPVGSPATMSPEAGACPPAAAASVTIRDFAFEPESITVAAGATVMWANEGPSVHTVTADDGSFDSMAIAPGSTFEMTFDTPGTYAYHCTPHPSMTGTIVVE